MAKTPKAMLTAPKLLTLEETMEYLRIGKWTALQAIKSGKLEASQLGNEYRITEDAIQEYLKNQRVKVEVAAK